MGSTCYSASPYKERESCMKKIILIIFVILLSGCSNQKDIDNTAYVVGLGVDVLKNDDFLITFLTALPTDNKEINTKSVSYSIPSKTIYSASNNLTSILNKKIDFSHCRIIVFSQSVAEKGLSFFKKTLLNEKSFRPDTLSAVSQINAYDYLNSDAIKESSNPAGYFELMFNSKNSPDTVTFTIKDFYTKKDVVIPLIDSSGIKGSVILKDGKFISYLSKRQTMVYKILTGDFNHSYLSFDEDLSVLSLSRDKKPDITVWGKNKDKVNITLYLSGEVITDNTSKDYTTFVNLLKTECENFITFTKKDLNCDILGIYDKSRIYFADEKQLKDFDFYRHFPNYNFKINIIYRPIITSGRKFDL